ncbi:MAG: biopolymer transporter ExbD [Bacteroidetes bacterium]|nr:biopolymer transporter ExbD [Bacteroidota bacterium]
MAIKRGNKIKAEFSMSSLTDIIFLLLIFFVLTSEFVNENGFKLQLPKGLNVKPEQETFDLIIDEESRYYIGPANSSREQYTEVARDQIESTLRNKLSGFDDYSATVVLKADENTPVKEITNVMSIGVKLKQAVILKSDAK